MKNKFVKDSFGADPDAVIINLNKDQIKRMNDMASKFPDVDNFELHINGNEIFVKFVLSLSDDVKKVSLK